jgi:flagellar protein FlaG
METKSVASVDIPKQNNATPPQAQTQTTPSAATQPAQGAPEKEQSFQQQQPKRDFVQDLLKDNEYMNVEFDDDTKRVVFQSVDRTSGEVINQFPSEEMLTLVAHFRQTVGVFTDQEV